MLCACSSPEMNKVDMTSSHCDASSGISCRPLAATSCRTGCRLVELTFNTVRLTQGAVTRNLLPQIVFPDHTDLPSPAALQVKDFLCFNHLCHSRRNHMRSFLYVTPRRELGAMLLLLFFFFCLPDQSTQSTSNLQTPPTVHRHKLHITMNLFTSFGK